MFVLVFSLVFSEKAERLVKLIKQKKKLKIKKSKI